MSSLKNVINACVIVFVSLSQIMYDLLDLMKARSITILIQITDLAL